MPSIPSNKLLCIKQLPDSSRNAVVLVIVTAVPGLCVIINDGLTLGSGKAELSLPGNVGTVHRDFDRYGRGDPDVSPVARFAIDTRFSCTLSRKMHEYTDVVAKFRDRTNSIADYGWKAPGIPPVSPQKQSLKSKVED